MRNSISITKTPQWTLSPSTGSALRCSSGTIIHPPLFHSIQMGSTLRCSSVFSHFIFRGKNLLRTKRAADPLREGFHGFLWFKLCGSVPGEGQSLSLLERSVFMLPADHLLQERRQKHDRKQVGLYYKRVKTRWSYNHSLSRKEVSRYIYIR